MTFSECFRALCDMANGTVKLEISCWRYQHKQDEVEVVWQAWISSGSTLIEAPNPKLLLERVRNALESTASGAHMTPEEVEI